MKKKPTSIFFAHAPARPAKRDESGEPHGLCPWGSTSQPETGFGLVEILVVVAIIAIALVALAGVGNFVLKLSTQLKNNVVATGLATEGLEVVRAVREENWNLIGSLAVGNSYYPAKSGWPLKWTLISGSETIGGFTRQIILNDVYRDGNDDIAGSGGTLDVNTKKITATVFWTEPGQNQEVSLTAYLTNWKP